MELSNEPNLFLFNFGHELEAALLGRDMCRYAHASLLHAHTQTVLLYKSLTLHYSLKALLAELNMGHVLVVGPDTAFQAHSHALAVT